MLNRVTLIGKLTKDAQKRVTRNGTELAHLDLETRETWRTEEGSLNEHIEQHEITVWSQANQAIDARIRGLVRGTYLYVEGRIQTAHQQMPDGSEVPLRRIIANRIRIMPLNEDNRETYGYSRA